jgi:hypothetical protein
LVTVSTGLSASEESFVNIAWVRLLRTSLITLDY